jgi:hypothetical protein
MMETLAGSAWKVASRDEADEDDEDDEDDEHRSLWTTLRKAPSPYWTAIAPAPFMNA